ncbi:hypothetical protein D3C71_450130 [compost metagenome]
MAKKRVRRGAAPGTGHVVDLRWIPTKFTVIGTGMVPREAKTPALLDNADPSQKHTTAR